ncbi:glycosyltransferase family 2 protein [Magnetovibrio sp.]|uniref:glycosyltransferase family 2 protein n=1 Tax=Magnetovibrio sp. TaxID=2024836 RepID=UPI002F92E381
MNEVASPKKTLTALVVAHNEEDNLKACLDTLRFADEIVVVLDKCTDGSKAIAAGYADKLIEGSWDIEGPRRHAGIDVCTSDWILEVDADERVSPELAAEIMDKIQAAPFGHFLIPYDNYVGDHLVRYGWGGSWGVSATVRLYARGAKLWGAQRVHPGVELKGERMWLENRMIHYVDRDISDMIRRLDRYSTARANDLRASGKIGSLPDNIRRLFSRFFKCYIGRKGYKEGLYGFLIALMAGLFPLLSYIKAKLEDGK